MATSDYYIQKVHRNDKKSEMLSLVHLEQQHLGRGVINSHPLLLPREKIHPDRYR